MKSARPKLCLMDVDIDQGRQDFAKLFLYRISGLADSLIGCSPLPDGCLVEQRVNLIDCPIRLAQSVAQLSQHIPLGGQVSVA